jgi:imidazoleglycerol-phosphate dehydratase/histidinol-phosphatase
VNCLPAPFSPLVSGGGGLERYPAPPNALASRMAEVYGVPAECVLPVRGATHGLELVLRLCARDGLTVEGVNEEPSRSLARLYRFAPNGAPVGARIVPAGSSLASLAAEAAGVAPALLVVDEGRIEFMDGPSATELVESLPNLLVLRSLSLAYGLAGARVGALVGQPTALARLASVLEPHALPEPSVRLALQALNPSRLLETRERLAAVSRERARLLAALGSAWAVEAGSGPTLILRPADVEATLSALARYGVPARREEDDLHLPVSARTEVNDRLLAALGAPSAASRPHRIGEAVRDTRETRIVCVVDLDASAPVQVSTAVGFFDHMLEQVAAHGGFSLRLACEGDLHIDPHHTVEDCAIALGQALRRALGDRRGIGRYGFVLPMDEARAQVSIDLSGRPYPVFEGEFATPLLGEYRTDLTAHVFRSLAEHLGAAIHVAVAGDDDHHKTEAVFKAFGRALRQAIRVEGEAVPSTKGVL